MSDSKNIYNQGRVVGYSAYEIYLKQYLSEQPDSATPPASEREWMSSMISSGSSLLLKVPAQGNDDDGLIYYDVELPRSSRLCAANTIVASFFNGEGNVPSGSAFADGVKSYGPLIRNDEIDSPDTDSFPSYSISELPQSTLLQLKDYIKIVDGVVLHPGDWESSGLSQPNKLLHPDLSDVPLLRLMIRGRIENPFFVLLTGFTMRTVVQGESKLDPTVNSSSPSDGDFLGPMAFPWANKIVFSVPNAFIKYFINANYQRKLPQSSESTVVDDIPIIDMKSNNIADYYSAEFNDSAVDIHVDRLTTPGECGAVLSVYQRSATLPPAIYGARIQGSGRSQIVPIDTVAPGTVKMFDKDREIQRAVDLETNVPHNYSILRDSATLQLYQLDANHDVVPVAEVLFSTNNIGEDSSNTRDTLVPNAVIKAGNQQVSALSLNDESGDPYPMSNSPSDEIESDHIKWIDLISALTRDKAINILGKVSSLKSALKALSGTGHFVIGLKEGVVSSLDSLNSVFKSGDGIKVDVDKDTGELIISNTKPNVEITKGIGIEIKKDGNKLIISNSMPNYASGSGWSTMLPGLDYHLKFMNAFTNSYTEAIKAESNYKIFRFPGLRTATKANRSGVLNIQAAESRKDTDNSLVSLALRVNNSVNAHQYAFSTSPIENYDESKISTYPIDGNRRYHTKIQHPNLRDVYMLHANNIYTMYQRSDGTYIDGFQSVMCRIRFLRDDYLRFAQSHSWANESSSGGTGIWNLQRFDDGSDVAKTTRMYTLVDGEYGYRIDDNRNAGSVFGASWQGRCALLKLTSGYFDNPTTGEYGAITQGNNEWQITQANAGISASKRTNTAAYNAMRSGDLQLGDLLLVFLQYADGYNKQFYMEPYRPSDIGAYFLAPDINLSISGAFS